MSLKEKQADNQTGDQEENVKQSWLAASLTFHKKEMDPDGFDGTTEEPHSSTPHLPQINQGYATPDSDYNYEIIKLQNKSSQDEKVKFTAVTDASTIYASSIVSDSVDSEGKYSHVTGGTKKSSNYSSQYGHDGRSVSPRKPTRRQHGIHNSKCSSSYTSSDYSESLKSSKDCKSSDYMNNQIPRADIKIRLQSSPAQEQAGSVRRRVSIDDGRRKEKRTFKSDQYMSSPMKQSNSSNSNKVIRSCTYAGDFGRNKHESTNFPDVTDNQRGSKSARELGLVLGQDLITPDIKSAKSSAKSGQAETEDAYTMGSPCKLSFIDSCSITRRSSPEKVDKCKNAWDTPRLSPQLYANIKERLLKEGKFKDQLRKYWGLDTQNITQPDSDDDDGYDTDLETNLGLELIADEKSREVIEDGIYPEYKHNCRRFKSTPNSYFMRNSLDDYFRMRYRYLNKGDSVAISTQIKNHLTMSDIDLKDNAIGPGGMNFFKHMLRENKRLTELNLACNNLGPEGARYLKHALSSNCFMLKLNIANNNFGEKGGKQCAVLISENVSLKEINISGNAIGDYGAILISKALEENVSLKLIDLSWNHIGRTGGVKLCECLKNNTELEVFRAQTNGFGDDGGKALINSLKVNHVLKEVDLSNNRLTDSFIKSLKYNLNDMEGLTVLKIARNSFQPKPIFEFLAAMMTAQTALTHIDIEGIHITEEFKGLANAIKVVQDVSVIYDDPPSKRECVTDILTHNLVVFCEFLEDHELEVEDLYPDYEEMEEEGYKVPMLTIGELVSRLEQSGKVTRHEKIQRLKSKLKLRSKRRFLISELALVYDNVICGKDIYREKPLRSHLRRSIKEERAEKERKARQKRGRNGQRPMTPVEDED